METLSLVDTQNELKMLIYIYVVSIPCRDTADPTQEPRRDTADPTQEAMRDINEKLNENKRVCDSLVNDSRATYDSLVLIPLYCVAMHNAILCYVNEQ